VNSAASSKMRHENQFLAFSANLLQYLEDDKLVYFIISIWIGVTPPLTARLRCARFSNSIHPTTIPKSNKDIRELLKCLAKDTKLYLDSAKTFEKIVSHFQESILPRLEQNQLSEKFMKQIKRYASTELAKTIFVTSNLERIFEKTVEDIDWWMEKYSRQAKIRRGQEESLHPDDLADLVKIAYGDFIHLSILLSQMFFALEFSTRMLCGLGCYRFALKVSNSEVIQHEEVWRQLKKLGRKVGYNCETCVVKSSCNFEVEFSILAKIYAYAMKIRQIVDYTTRLASLNLFKSELLKPPFVYFSSLIKIVEKNFEIGRQCIPQNYLHLVADPFIIFERKQLYSPFSWDERELKNMTAKNPKDALAWYLLGKLYFKRNDTYPAIECMEKAKMLNPKNSDIWHSLGILYDVSAKTIRDERKALKHLEKARGLDANNVEILIEIGAMYIALGNLSQAIENLDEAMKLSSNNSELSEINQILSKVYEQIGDSVKAKHFSERAKELAPDYQTKVRKWLDSFLTERKKWYPPSKH